MGSIVRRSFTFLLTAALSVSFNFISVERIYAESALSSAKPPERDKDRDRDRNDPRPRPVPDPAPQQPTPYDIERARDLGRQDARPDGEREGNERGSRDGESEGYEDGRKSGYDQCFEEAKRDAYESGYMAGNREGENAGYRDGAVDGERDGLRDGKREGITDGNQRADRDAEIAAQGPGSAKGREEANQTNAEQIGYNEGLKAGEIRARATAVKVDYARGRKDLKEERYSEAVENNDSFAQKKPFAFSEMGARVMSLAAAGIPATPWPDCRYCNMRRSFRTPQETEAYRSAYTNMYQSSFRTSYDSTYRTYHDLGFRSGKDRGCRDAKNQDFRRYYDNGFDTGRNDGYRREHKRSYDLSYKSAYDRRFREASDDTYRDTYRSYYDNHFEKARSSAYQARYKELYDIGFGRGDDENFRRYYPAYAKQEYQRGRDDEAKDFDEQPVRFVSAEITETIVNGLYEPGEPLRFQIQLRNFAAKTVDSNDIVLSVQAFDSEGAVVSEPVSKLAQSLRSKSLTRITEVSDFVLTEEALRRAGMVVLTVSNKGKQVSSKTFNLQASYLVGMEFVERPKLSEGLASTIKVRVKNQSSSVASGPVKVELLSDSAKIELVQKENLISDIPPGGFKIVEFVAIARTPESSPRIPLALLATSETSRRVGAMDFSGDVPVLNDYRISVDGETTSLRKSGITRIPYKIRNISSRLLFKGLQLRVRVLNNDTDDFVIMGPNPQYLTPLDNGQSLTFVFPVLVKNSNAGATIELEVQEDGRTTVIHRLNFKE